MLFGLVFSLGIMATFAVLGCLVLLGHHAWGDLFAKAWFVWTLVVILVTAVFALTMSLFDRALRAIFFLIFGS